VSAKRYLTEREQPQQSRVGDTYVSKGTTSRDEAVNDRASAMLTGQIRW